MRVSFAGVLNEGVSAKDLILFTIRELTASGGAGYAIEFAGLAIEALSVEARLTLCNMTTELSAFTGLIAPDQKVLDYCAGRRYAPQAEVWHQATQHWQLLRSDEGAAFDQEHHFDIGSLKPQLSWGTSPQHCVDWDAAIPHASDAPDASESAAWQRAQDYMGVTPGSQLSLSLIHI